MKRAFLFVPCIGIYLAAFSPADAPKTPAKPDAAAIAKLVIQLSDQRFQVREESYKALKSLGMEALPTLRELAKQSLDAETRRRLEEIIPLMERSIALAPTRITIQLKDKPMGEAIKMLSQQSGYTVKMWQGGNARDKQVYTVNIRNAPFWEALQQLADQCGMSWHENHEGPQKIAFQFYDQNQRPGLLHHDGAFRVNLQSFSYNKNLSFNHYARNNADETLSRSESLSVQLAVTAEPKLFVLGAGPAAITEAKDDQNQSMILTDRSRDNWQHHHHYYHGGYRSLTHHVHAQLLPARAGAQLKILKGEIPMRLVASQKPIITIDNLDLAKKKTFKAGKTTITIDDVTRQNDQMVLVKMSVADSSPRDPNDWSWQNSVGARFELTDARGEKWQFSGNSTNGGQNNISGTFHFVRSNGGQPAVGRIAFGNLFRGKAKETCKLVFNEWNIVNHAVAFEFTDLPLP